MSLCNVHYYHLKWSCRLKESSILAKLPEGRVFVLHEVNSTNQYIIDHISSIQSGDVFTAEHQTHGRGRRGKVWFTSFGQNICLSIYWKLPKILLIKTEFSLIISVIIANIFKSMGVSQIKIKWPNDLYIYGHKLAGILIEIIKRPDGFTHIIIGIGINVSMCKECFKLKTAMNINWVNLNDVGLMLNRNELIAILVKVLRDKLKILEYYGFKSFYNNWSN